MSDQWVRTPAQRAAVELQQLIEASRRADVVARTYPGAPAQAYAGYQADAAQMIPAGWRPIAQQFVGVTVDAGQIALFGVLAPSVGGVTSLVVTWQYQGPDAPVPADPLSTRR